MEAVLRKTRGITDARRRGREEGEMVATTMAENGGIPDDFKPITSAKNLWSSNPTGGMAEKAAYLNGFLGAFPIGGY